MAPQGWTSSIATAAGVAAGVGAAQLGLGYGLGIVSWQPPADGDRAAVWAGNVTWTVWVTATAVVVGALVADRLAGRAADAGTVERTGRGLWRLVLAAAAAVGGLATAVLIAIPARDAPDTGTLAPATAAAGYALAGLIVGLAGAAAALRSAAVAANVVASASAVWLLTIVSVVCGALGLGPADTALGSWPLASGADVWFRGLHVPAVTLSLLGAALLGVLSAWLARHASRSGLGAAVSGAAGPLLVAVAYLLAGPRVTGAAATQLSAYLTAPYAVLAGIAGSLLVTAARVAGPAGAAGPAPRRRLPPAALPAGQGGAPAAPATPPRPRKSTAAQGSSAARAAATGAEAANARPANGDAARAAPTFLDGATAAEDPSAEPRGRATRRRATTKSGSAATAKSGSAPEGAGSDAPTGSEADASGDSDSAGSAASTGSADAGPEAAKATRRPRTRRPGTASAAGEDGG